MKSQYTLILCFLPLAVIYIVMKVAVWMSAINAESDYVEKNLYENEDPIWRTRMQMLMKKKRNLEIAQTIDKVLYDHYSEQWETCSELESP